MRYGKSYRLMEATPGADGAGAAGAGGGSAGAQGAGQAGAAGAGAAGAGAGAAPSALSTAAAAEWSWDAIPEKYRALGEDGQPDHLAALRKVDGARAELERRFGAGDVRPKTADEYKLPDNDAFKALKLDDEATKGFREKAHAAGFSQAQYEFAMSQWAELAPQLVTAGKTESVGDATAALQKHWGDNFASEMQGAFKAVQGIAAKAGLSYDEVDQAIGNNPTAIRLFAALSKEMAEDRTPASAAGAPGAAGETRNSYVAANWAAYTDPTNPQHATVTARAAQLAAREGGKEPI